MYELLQTIILGIIQGLTEFIPVSSSGHLIIFEELLDSEFTSLAYDVILHFGTLLALLVYFWRDIWKLLLGILRPGGDRRLVLYLIVATIPAVIAGFFLQDIVQTLLRSLWVVVVMFVVVALLMFVADRRGGDRRLESVTFKDAVLIGLAQVASLIPGTSRAGATLVAGSLLRFNNAEAATFSFYMAIPIIFGANVRMFFSEGIAAEVMSEWQLFGLGAVVSAVVGYLVIAVLLRYLRTHSLALFAWYRIALAALLTLLLVI